MLPGRRCHFVVPWVFGPPLKPQRLITPWKPRSILKHAQHHRHHSPQHRCPSLILYAYTHVGGMAQLLGHWCYAFYLLHTTGRRLSTEPNFHFSSCHHSTTEQLPITTKAKPVLIKSTKYGDCASYSAVVLLVQSFYWWWTATAATFKCM